MGQIVPPGLLANSPTAAAARKTLLDNFSGVNVLDYGAVDDGRRGFFFATFASAGTTLSLYTSNVAVTVSNTGPGGVALVTMPGAGTNAPYGPQKSWVGNPIAINGAGTSGATLVARVTGFYYDGANSDKPTAILNIAAPTPLSSSTQQVACPCFTTGSDGSGMATDVGKALWNSLGGAVTGNSKVQYAASQIMTISAVTSAFQVSVAAFNSGAASWSNPVAFGAANPGTYIEWGTDNTVALQNAGYAALNAGQSVLFFAGLQLASSTGRFGIYKFETGGTPTSQDLLNSVYISAMHWIGTNASSFMPPTLVMQWDNQIYKPIIPVNAPSPPPPPLQFNAPVHLPRCNTLSSITLLVVGDSWANQDPSGTGNPVQGPFVHNFIRQNLANKRVYVVWGTGGLYWHTVITALGSLSTVAVDGLGTVTPDLVLFAVTGGNDASALHRNEIQQCINIVRGWGTANGFPPDVAMITGTYPRTLAEFTANQHDRILQKEYASVLQRSVARKSGIPLLDYARHGGFALRGWSEDALAIKQVPPLAAGTAGPTSPYVIPYTCRDFLFVFALGTAGQTGAAFWTAAGWLAISLSPKPDNRAYFYCDTSNYLNVLGVTWGLPVSTTITMSNGSAAITTSGQTPLTVNGYDVIPTFNQASVGLFSSGMVGQCWLTNNDWYDTSTDFRTYVMGYTNGNNIQLADANGAQYQSASTTTYWGGQMFIASDAAAKADIIVAGAGSVTHPLTGANSLVTTVSAFSTNFSATLAAANANATITATAKNVFLGKIHQPGTYNKAVAAGSDAAAYAYLAVRLQGTVLKVSYVLGQGSASTDLRTTFGTPGTEAIVWEGEIERYGAPFFPKVWAQASVTIQPVYCWIDDFQENLFLPRYTMQDAFGVADPNYDGPFGGDFDHPSHKYLEILGEVSSTQNLAALPGYANNNGSNVPTTGFTYSIPANQAFTELAPAGTLASGTVNLPSVFPQGGRLEIFSTQTVTALTITPATGFTAVGTAVTTIAAGGTISYRLLGTTWCRVQ